MSRSARVAALLERVPELCSVFQPILALRLGHVLGYEALLRLPLDAPFANPAAAFEAAAQTDLLVDLELAALAVHLQAARGLEHARLFVNVSARTLLDRRASPEALLARVSQAGLRAQQVVLELTELVRIRDPERLAAALQPLRRAGFTIAVDDFGAGFSNFQLLMVMAPDMLKIDRAFVSGAGRDVRKRVFLESLATLGRRVGCLVIAEGVEGPGDVTAVRACGIPYAQGWALASPAPSIGRATMPVTTVPNAAGRPGRHDGRGARAAAGACGA